MKKIVSIILLFIFCPGVPVYAERVQQKPLDKYKIEKPTYIECNYNGNEMIEIPNGNAVIVENIKFSVNHLNSAILKFLSNNTDKKDFKNHKRIAFVYLRYIGDDKITGVTYSNFDFSLVSDGSNSIPYNKEYTYFVNNHEKSAKRLIIGPYEENNIEIVFDVPDDFDLKNAKLKMVYRNGSYKYIRLLFDIQYREILGNLHKDL